MKILTINCVYNKGSTGNIIQDIDKTLIEHEFFHCYEVGEKPLNKYQYRISTRVEFYGYYLLARILGLKYGTGYTTTLRLLYHIRKVNPDIVHIHCPNCYTVNIYWLLNYLKKNRIKTVITNHAEFFYTGNCPHAFECEKYKTGCGKCDYVFDSHRPFLHDRTSYEWKKMRSAMKNNPNLKMVVVSPWQAQRLKSSPITKDYSPKVIYNGIDVVQIFHPQLNNIRKEYNISQKNILLHVTADFSDATDDQKGGRYVVEVANKLKNVAVVVVGPYELKKKEYPENLIFVGSIGNRKKMAEFYTAADLTIIASKRETFGMACAESLCCGTPVVGFQAGGPETIAIKEYSEFVKYGDVKALTECVEKWITFKKECKDDISTIASDIYSKQKMAQKYGQIYDELYNNEVTK